MTHMRGLYDAPAAGTELSDGGLERLRYRVDHGRRRAEEYFDLAAASHNVADRIVYEACGRRALEAVAKLERRIGEKEKYLRSRGREISVL